MRFAFVILAGTALSGCATFQKQAAVNPLTVIEAKAEFCSAMINKYDDKEERRIKEIYEPICFVDSNSQRGSKDYVINLMMMADMVCARELRSLSANQRTVDTVLSTTSTLFASAATVVTGGLADDILAGLSGLSGSTRDHINSRVYRDGQPELITRLIQADRTRIATRIRLASAEQGYSDTQAIYDANQYHQACSYYNGLALLTEAATDKAKDLATEPNEENENTEGQ